MGSFGMGASTDGAVRKILPPDREALFTVGTKVNPVFALIRFHRDEVLEILLDLVRYQDSTPVTDDLDQVYDLLKVKATGAVPG